jgi:methionyl-tRNA synthetase
LAKEEDKKDRLETVLYNLLESIRVCGLLLKPFIPETSDKIKTQIANTKEELSYLEDNTYKVGTPEALFMRIDKDKLFQELGVNE